MSNNHFRLTYGNLQARGVKDLDFLFRLDNKELENINPYDRNLNEEQKLAIIEEAKNNLWYFIREIVRVSECVYANFVLDTNSVMIFRLLELGFPLYIESHESTNKTAMIEIFTKWKLFNDKSHEVAIIDKSIEDSNLIKKNICKNNKSVFIPDYFYKYDSISRKNISIKELVDDPNKNVLDIYENIVIINNANDVKNNYRYMTINRFSFYNQRIILANVSIINGMDTKNPTFWCYKFSQEATIDFDLNMLNLSKEYLWKLLNKRKCFKIVMKRDFNKIPSFMKELASMDEIRTQFCGLWTWDI